ncbi:hypothetical protein BRE01_67360 [Brevibacillus reuszeri]|uniref:Uncharacterized protein n=1 Tax=Brevibacillus reuszeri TaxID=54915 RepID=A0ABQ0TZ70_9BACL|nr:hypothetical protein BRE01_67360 [Brevibacillus reuszeri]
MTAGIRLVINQGSGECIILHFPIKDVFDCELLREFSCKLVYNSIIKTIGDANVQSKIKQG